MALDQFKTQVLLLHSEETTLENLRSGFSDSYTVHCATTGSEALNTLVETPINVIISAQDLLGMSGLDALREAKKRSPDTIGILLAGNADEGLEAMVGDEEVFQIVRGAVTGNGLLKLVENATRQMRLMALAESANDTAANPDQPATQHIVMETSENGSTIISDGTGRMPALDPKKIAAAVSVGSRAVDVLVLTQDQEFLQTIKDSSRGMHQVYYANTLAQANEAITKFKVGVAVVDAAMVGDKVEQLTQYLRQGSARLVCIVAGRRDDGEMLMDLINRGKVYRFLLKPVSPGRARLAVEASVKHHLEAPDTAFTVKPVAAAAPAARPVPKQAAAARAAADPPMGSTAPAAGSSPIEDGLADAFGDDDGSFTETIAGLFSTVAARFSSEKNNGAAPAAVDVAAAIPAPAAKPVPAKKPVQPRKPVRAKKPVQPRKPVQAKPVAAKPVPAKPMRAKPAPAKPMRAKPVPATPLQAKPVPAKPVQAKPPVAAKPLPARPLAPKPPRPAMTPLQRPAASNSGVSLLKSPKLIGIAAAAVVAVAGALYWTRSGPDEPAVTQDAESGNPTISEANVGFGAAATAAVDVDTLLDNARRARDAGRIFKPSRNNAIEFYAAALDADRGNLAAAIELEEVLETALGMAESAMLESRFSDADTALRRVKAADADNLRLPFLTAQLAQTRLRGHLDNARSAIRDSRFEDAATALRAARNLGIANAAEISIVAGELNTARSEQRVDDVLAKANAKLDAGELLSPANDNARYYYNLALSNDAENTAARQGLSIISSKLVLQAQAEINSGDLDAARDSLAEAQATDASNAEIATALDALASARTAAVSPQRGAIAGVTASAVSKAQADNARQAEAERLAAREPANVVQPQDEAATDVQSDNPVNEEIAAATAGGEAAGIVADETVRAAPDVLQPVINTLNDAPVAVSSLNRIKYVAPKYPRAAQRRNQSGWVDIVFTVAMDGSVKDIDVRDSEPGDTFTASAIKAVEKWQFEAIVEDGVLVEKRAGVRMMFALE